MPHPQIGLIIGMLSDKFLSLKLRAFASSPGLICPSALSRPARPGSVQLMRYDKYILAIYQLYIPCGIYLVYTITRQACDWYQNVAKSLEWIYTWYTIYVVIIHVYSIYISGIYQIYDIPECHISGMSVIYLKYDILCSHGTFLHVICRVYTKHIGIIYMH